MRRVNCFKFIIVPFMALLFAGVVSAACDVEQYDRERPDHLYLDNGDGTVTDQETGLTWFRCPVGVIWNPGTSSCDGAPSLLNWQEALDAAASSAVAGASWRLANKKELSTLMDRTCNSPAMNTVFFPKVSSGMKLWTSTAKITSGQNQAWYIVYNNGEDATTGKGATAGVYLVRN